ncbi:MAG TPA: efflux RND transporter periplasmic adaptor subunit [Stenomitos sp.]
MTCSSHRSYSSTSMHRISGAFLSLLLLTATVKVLAHGGHGNEFQSGSQPAQSVGAIHVDLDTARRMGLKVEPVSQQRLAFGIKTTGQIEPLPNQQVEVTTPVGGTVIRLLVRPGETVAAGQPVAIMTSPELAELRTTAFDRRSEAIATVKQAQADLGLAQENYRQQQTIAITDVQQAKTELSFAQERYEKDKELVDRGALPRRTVLESETKLAEARAALAKAESRLQVAEAAAQLKRAQSAVEVAQSRIALSGATYQTRLRQLGANPNQDGTITITAPIAGTVTDREATTGESGQDAGKKIMTIVNSSSVQVSANIHEKDLKQVRIGQRVRVKVNGFPDRTFEGWISVMGAVVDGQTRVVPVKAELANPNGVLKPGMFAELEVLTDRTTAAVLVVPKSAIVETNNKKQVVFVQNGNAFQPTEVTLGKESGDFVEVKNGLFDGDRVVIQRATQLYAQSLRGGTKSDGDHGPINQAPMVSQNGQLPWWVTVSVGGVIAVGTFWAGTFWANHRYRKVSIPRSDDGEYELSNYPNGSSAKPMPHQSVIESTSKHPSLEVESPSPHQPR